MIIARIMRGQHSVARRDQLSAAGLTRGEIDGRIERGLLIPRYRGVYASAFAAPSLRAGWMAATLACGDAAVLSHLAAARLHGLLASPPRARVDITIPSARRARRGFQWHRDRIAADEIRLVGRIPVTAVARTLRDCASLVTRHVLDRAIDDAYDLLRHDPMTIRAVIARYPRHPGSVILRRAIIDRGGVTRSWLERRFSPILRGLPRPLRNEPIRLRDRTIEPDCLWPERRLIVELDGRTYHERHAAFERDRQRDWDAAVAGYRTLRLTWLRIRDDHRQIRSDLAELLAA